MKLLDATLHRLGYVPAARLSVMTEERYAGAPRGRVPGRDQRPSPSTTSSRSRRISPRPATNAARYYQQYESEKLAHGLTTQALDEANAMITELQRERPQMRLLESPTRKTPAAEPSEGDRIVHQPHDAEIVCRLVTIHFEGTRRHWVLRRDNDVFKAAVHDKRFLNELIEGKPLASTFLVRGRFTETGYQTGDGHPYTKRILEEVLEVITPDAQTNAFDTVLPLTAGGERATP